VTQFDIIQVIAFVFGLAWLAITLYTFLPLIQYAVVSILSQYTPLSTGLGELVTTAPTEPLTQTPVIDVLLPAYNDGNVVEQAISSLRATNYPAEALNINVLVEPTDDGTQEALAELSAEYDFTTIVVPESYPLTNNKPRALNYGFATTSGDVVGVIDAEDIVDPQLFSYVVTSLFIEGKDYVQGKLDMVNESDGWKNLLFRGEYAYWYALLLKGFFTVGYPVPLGGTTNFFHRSTLDKISEIRVATYGSPWPEDASDWFDTTSVPDVAPWDPLNVTEDFELGLLLWLHEFDIGFLDVTTREESPIDYSNWIIQRTRWEKGKIYTLFQWLKTPPTNITRLFHLLFQSFLPHYAVINISGIVLLLLYSNFYQIPLAGMNQLLLLVTLSIVVLLAVTHSYAYALVSDYVPRWKQVVRSVIIGVTLPAYWALYWAATLRALYQVYTGNLLWEKTTHHGRNIPTEDSETDETEKTRESERE
jgi:cellulose synthase/poly-beta-1,6-N-acetylglucosamine synthase-like glycosyltransferase